MAVIIISPRSSVPRRLDQTALVDEILRVAVRLALLFGRPALRPRKVYHGLDYRAPLARSWTHVARMARWSAIAVPPPPPPPRPVGEHAFHADLVAAAKGGRAAQERVRGRCTFVPEHFGVGEATVVFDGDVHVLPVDPAAGAPARVAPAGPAVGSLLRCSTRSGGGHAGKPRTKSQQRAVSTRSRKPLSVVMRIEGSNPSPPLFCNRLVAGLPRASLAGCAVLFGNGGAVQKTVVLGGTIVGRTCFRPRVPLVVRFVGRAVAPVRRGALLCPARTGELLANRCRCAELACGRSQRGGRRGRRGAWHGRTSGRGESHVPGT